MNLLETAFVSGFESSKRGALTHQLADLNSFVHLFIQ